MAANDRQVGGNHYKRTDGGEEHWDRVHRLGLDYFQAQITKYVERWKLKGKGLEDLEKAMHVLQKYMELEKTKAAEKVPKPDTGNAEPATPFPLETGRYRT